MRPASLPHIAAEEADGRLRLLVPRTGFWQRLGTRWLDTPDRISIALDAFGSFVWQYCDGRHTVSEIAGAMEERFGVEAEPVLERLVVFLRMMVAGRLIRLLAAEAEEVSGECR